MIKKLIPILLISVLFAPSPLYSLSIDDLNATISRLLGEIEILQKKLAEISKKDVSVSLISSPLSYGMTHPEVVLLQKALNNNKKTRVSDFGAGSVGFETNYFGTKTLEALKRFQNIHKNGIGNYTPGVLNAKTVSLLNMLIAPTSVNVTQPNPQTNTANTQVVESDELILEKISPESGGPQPTITLFGSGFHKTNNTIHTTFEKYENVPSPDGQTISLKLKSDKFPESTGDSELRKNAIARGETEGLAPEHLKFYVPIYITNNLGTSTVLTYVISY